jgi:hypothetical protein
MVGARASSRPTDGTPVDRCYDRRVVTGREDIVRMGARRVPTLRIVALAALAALAAPACVGKLLTVPAPEPDASSPGSDAKSAGPMPGSASSSGNGGGSSRGSDAPVEGVTMPPPPPPPGGSGASSGSGAGSTTMCLRALDCPAGQVCCATPEMTTICQIGSCPGTVIGPLQLCSSPSECLTPGDTCGAPVRSATLPIKVCNAPMSAAVCASTCTAGCCDANGICNGGASDTACGTGGEVCTDCTTVTGGICGNQACYVVTAGK